MSENPPDPTNAAKLEPDREALLQFTALMFRNADPRGCVSLRAFRDNDKRDQKPILIEAIRLNDPDFAAIVYERARLAAAWPDACVFCPPVATFQNHQNAKTDNLFEGVDLSTECDQSPRAARSTLEALLGPATAVVESGGEWTSPTTGEIEPKLHLHWRLKKPTAAKAEHALLREARALAANLVGGDGTNKSVVHPIRWAGSVHRKGTPRLARIVASSEASEIDLTEAIDILREATGTRDFGSAGAGTNGTQGTNGTHFDFNAFGFRTADKLRAADDAAVACALAVIPNGDLAWDDWNRIGMATWAAAGGSEAGRKAFHEWSAKAAKNDPAATEARWRHYFTSPPTLVGFGTLVYLARQHSPGWSHSGNAKDCTDEFKANGSAEAEAEAKATEDDEFGPAPGAGNGAGTGSSSSSTGAAGSTSSGPGAGSTTGTRATGSQLHATPYVWTDPEKIPPRDWLYGRLLIRKFVTATIAPGGLGKSSLVTVETLAQVADKDLLGVKPSGELRVWLINLEDPSEETTRKLQAVAKHYGLSKDDLGDRLFADSGREQEFVIAKMQQRGGPMLVVPALRAIVAEIVSRKIDVLVIDPFVSSHEVPENDNVAQDMVVKAWAAVAEAIAPFT